MSSDDDTQQATLPGIDSLEAREDELRGIAMQLQDLSRRLLGADPRARVDPLAPSYLPVHEYAARRRVSASTVRRWILFGLPVARAGRTVRVRVIDADRWIDAGGADRAIEDQATKDR